MKVSGSISIKTELNEVEKHAILRLWNSVYPAQLAYNNIKEFEAYLNGLSNHRYYIFQTEESGLIGWAFSFNRESEKWFAILVDDKFKKKSIGTQLLNALKSEEVLLNGWVIDHENYVRQDGEPYKSPLDFYLKNKFVISPWNRLEIEKLSAVRIRLPEFKKIETERFLLREMNELDAENIFQLNQDPNVFRFTGDKPFKDVEVAKQFIQNYSAYKRNGIGRWIITDKVTNQFYGWCGLRFTDEDHEVDVGYRIHPDFRNKGIATETAKACIDYGFNTLHCKYIIANVHPENKASLRVVEKTGMKFRREKEYDGFPWMQFIIMK